MSDQAIALAFETGLPFVGLRDHEHDPELDRVIPPDAARFARVIPLSATDDHVRLAAADAAPDLGSLQRYLGDRRVDLAIAPREELEELLGPAPEAAPAESLAEPELLAAEPAVAEGSGSEEGEPGAETLAAEPEPELEAVGAEAEALAAEPLAEPEPPAVESLAAEPEPPAAESLAAEPEPIAADPLAAEPQPLAAEPAAVEGSGSEEGEPEAEPLAPRPEPPAAEPEAESLAAQPEPPAAEPLAAAPLAAAAEPEAESLAEPEHAATEPLAPEPATPETEPLAAGPDAAAQPAAASGEDPSWLEPPRKRGWLRAIGRFLLYVLVLAIVCGAVAAYLLTR